MRNFRNEQNLKNLKKKSHSKIQLAAKSLLDYNRPQDLTHFT